jgi:guanine deaminase
MKNLKGKVLRASGFDAPVCGEIRFFDRALFAIGEDGMITAVTQKHEQAYDEQVDRATADGSLVEAGEGTYLLPGFVDTHIHAPQYPQAGNALDEPLEIWLNKYTFPLEARYRDLAYAERIYRLLITDLLADGTTTALYFTTIHEQATKMLADLCLELGQRALVGKLVMDNPDTCPDYYRDADTNSALKSVAAVIDHIASHPDNRSGLVRPVILQIGRAHV